MIEVHNLTFGYSATEDGQILKGVDFAAKTGKLTASDYTHLLGYLNPYYRSAYNIPKRRK